MNRLLALWLLCTGCSAAGPTGNVVPAEHVYEQGAVAADHPLASEAGARMLRAGGNAMDAAVAASFCLSVVDPFSCGIGGGGFMVVWDPATQKAWALNYRETAPASMRPDTFSSLDDPLASRYGALSVGVPGNVAGLLEALDRWGTLDRATVLAPAIEHARNGFPVNAAYLSAVDWVRSVRTRHPRLEPVSQWVWDHLCGGGSLVLGDVVRQPGQADVLDRIARDGAAAFYEGPVAEAIVATIAAHGGDMTRSDLRAYAPATVPALRSPLVFDRYTLLSMPPPSSGGIAMQQMLRMIDRRLVDVPNPSLHDPRWVQLVTETMKHAFADRATHLADGTFQPVPVDRLLDGRYVVGRADAINLDRTGVPTDYGSVAPPPSDSGTSHLSVVDADGMAVACTETINLSFGSLLAVPEYGIVLNDELDDFTARPGEANAFGLVQSSGNAPEAGKRPLSSMSPTIVLEEGRVRLVAGASGGPRIITGTMQVILNCLLLDMTPARAVAAARFHHQWLPDTLQFEERWTDHSLIESMEGRGHVVGRRRDVGVVQVVDVLPDGRKRAASDPRKGGRPAGH
ncbi:MAG: gamma-glutamyltransferase [Phycisphaerae bacterium]|nr:gamma-glutamyltransferase [Phycisphaerae bacterium]